MNCNIIFCIYCSNLPESVGEEKLFIPDVTKAPPLPVDPKDDMSLADKSGKELEINAPPERERKGET